MKRFLVCLGLVMIWGCSYNDYLNKETGTADTAGKDISTQRTAAPQGQTIEATNQAEKQRPNHAMRQ